MTSIEIQDVKNFMNLLLLREKFDSFRCLQYLISGYADFSMEGDVPWKEVKPLVLSMIKGHDTPQKMKFVFALKQEQIAALLARAGLDDAQDVTSMNFTLLYQEGHLICTTGFARSSFTMDRKAEQYWDATMERFLEDA